MAKLTQLPEDTTAYQDMNEALLPRGPIWRSDGVRGMAAGLGVEAVRFHNRLVDLMREAFPSTAFELLAEWESEFGLPLCQDAPDTLEARQAALAGRVAAKGGQDVHYYRALVRAVLGDPNAVVTIVEWPYGRPFYAWISHAWEPLGGRGVAHVWRVILPSGVDPALVHIIECLLTRFKPSHTRLELVSDVSAYYESLDGDGNSYLETSTPIASRLAFSGAGTVNEFTLLMWVAQLDGAGRSLVRIGELSEDAIVTTKTDRDTHAITNYRTSFVGSIEPFAMPNDADYHLVEVSTPGGSAALVSIYVDGVLAEYTGFSPGSYPNPADVMRLLELGGAARVRNVGMTNREITSDERVALAAAGYRHDYRAGYETDDGKVWAGEVLPFMWCTAARPAWPYWRLEPGGAELSSSGYTTLPYLQSNFLFWFRVLNGANGLLVYEPNLIADNSINVIENNGETFRLAWNSFLGTTTLFGTLPVGQWCALAFIDGYGPFDDFALLLNGAVNLTASGTGLTRLGGNPVFGGEDLLIDIRAPIYVARKWTPGPPSQGYRPAEITAHYALGPEHDPRIPSGSWTAQDVVIAWADQDVGGEVANGGSGGTHPLVLSGDIETRGDNARVINSGSAGECDLVFYGDVTSEED